MSVMMFHNCTISLNSFYMPFYTIQYHTYLVYGVVLTKHCTIHHTMPHEKSPPATHTMRTNFCKEITHREPHRTTSTKMQGRAMDAKRHEEYKDKNVRKLMCHAHNFDSFHIKNNWHFFLCAKHINFYEDPWKIIMSKKASGRSIIMVLFGWLMSCRAGLELFRTSLRGLQCHRS
jgi:hypothetical protein